MSDEFDDAVRTMLRTRADEITEVSAALLAAGDHAWPQAATASPGRITWRHTVLAAVAAAVAVLLVGGIVVVVRHGRPDHPATPPTTRTCQTQLPRAWLAPPLSAATPLTFLPDGTAVLARTISGTVAVLAGSRVVYQISGRHSISPATTDGRWLVLGVADYPNALDGLASIALVDLHTGSSLVLADAPNGAMIDTALLFAGQVYWDVRPRQRGVAGSVLRYNPVTGARTAIYHGTVTGLSLTGAGLQWSGTSDAAAQLAATLPPIVRAAVGANPPAESVSTDGSAYAWTTRSGTLGWWRPGMDAPRHFVVPPRAGPPTPSASQPTVAGPLVAANGVVLDARSGAYAVLGDMFIAVAAYGQMVVEPSDFVYYSGGLMRYLAVNTRTLPPLSC